MKSISRDFKGIWIPKDVWLNSNLTMMEKLFFIEIDSLDGEKGCYASNAHFADFFGVEKTYCSKIIKKLEAKKMIKITLERKGKCITKRVIRVCSKVQEGMNKSASGVCSKVQVGYEQKCKGSNTKDNNTKDSNTERETRAEHGSFFDKKMHHSKTFIQDDFMPSETTLFHLEKNGHKKLNSSELEIFILHYQGGGIAKTNWDAVYRKWVVTQRTIYDKQNLNQDRNYSLDELGEAFVNGE